MPVFEKLCSFFKSCCTVDQKVESKSAEVKPLPAQSENNKIAKKNDKPKSVVKKTVTKKKPQAKKKTAAQVNTPNRTPKNKN